MKSLHFLTLLCVIISVENARILGVFHFPSFSHNIVGKTILKVLSRRGHQVTMIGTFPLNPPMENYEDIFVEELLKFKEEGIIKMVTEAENGSIIDKITTIDRILMRMNEICLSDTSVQNILSSNRSFDLMLVDWAVTDSILGIAHHYKAPVIAVSAVGSWHITNKVTANPLPFSYVPNLFVTGSHEMNFSERLLNTVSTILLELQEVSYREPWHNKLMHRFFPHAPPITDLLKNVSLVFLNSHFTIESPRPYVSSMIPIGGVHIEEPNKLDKDLQKFMDEALEGVLYFSLGGNAKSEDIIKTFCKLPVKVLWKVELENDIELPSNVRTEKWIPQTDVLGHPNMKVFVTHEGMLSTIEALYRGVPMVGIPCFGDQEFNVKNSVKQEHSVMAKVDELTENTLYNAITVVLNNPRYQENIKKRSAWLRDQPIKPIDNAIFWTEYVLRHKGGFHLQMTAIKQKWYEYYLVDVIAVLVIVVSVSLFILWKITKLLAMLFKKVLYKQKKLLKK